MKWPVFFVLAATACQSGETDSEAKSPANTTIIQLPKAQVTDAYRADITTLCDVMRLSGADQKPKDEQWTVVAMYLGPQLKTTESRDFLAAIQPLRGEPKALALETEATRVGLKACPLAADWRAAAAAAAAEPAPAPAGG